MNRHDQHIDPRTLERMSPLVETAINCMTAFLIGTGLAAVLFFGLSK